MEVIHSQLLDMVNLLHLELKQKTENSMKPIIKLLKSVDLFREPAIGLTDQELYSLSKGITTKMFRKGAKILTVD
jgi:hypothetical protein